MPAKSNCLTQINDLDGAYPMGKAVLGMFDARFSIDEKQIIVGLSKRSAALFGYKAGELIGQPVHVLVPQHLRKAHRKRVQDFITSPDQIRPASGGLMRVNGLSKSGEEIPAEAGCMKGAARDGSLRLAFFMNDASKTFNALRQLGKSKKLLSDIQLLAKLGFWEHNLQRDELVWSDQMFKICGIGLRKFGGRYSDMMALIHPDDRKRVDQEYNEKLASGGCYDIDFRLRRDRRERVKHIHCTVAFHTDTDDNTIRAVGTMQDVTKRRETELALAKSEELHRLTLSNISDAVFVATCDGEFTYVSPNVGMIFAQSQAKVLASGSVESLFGDSLQDLFGNQIRDMCDFCDDREVRNLERVIVDSSGKQHTLLINLKQVEIEGCNLLISCRDITERKKGEKELHNALVSTIHVMSRTLDKRDPYTAGHSMRVAQIARAIGEEMGLGCSRIEGLELAASIHDIGKIGTPAEILTKPTRLIAPELALVRTHAEAGYDILKELDLPWPIAEMVYQHHERLDGSGYPRGLKGDEIVLEACIIAVADTVEAMANPRPYRPAVGIGKALAEIEDGSGTRYDAGVVKACLELFREKKFKLREAA